jgi:Tol biopolymer transport system component
VVYTQAPTAVNLVEASSTASFATAVALTTGTPTPLPLNWITATPPPVSVAFALLTPVPTATPTLIPISLPELAKRPLDSFLYNKIAFLSGDRSSPTAWIVDPDGTNLAQLSDRTYYDIAAARDTVSPDGVWFLYNAPDQNDRLQIWRRNLVSSDVPPQQITYHERGYAYGAVWLLDGSIIAYTSTKDGREQEIFMFDLNNPHAWPRLSFSQDSYLWSQYPSWSPDGTKIAFSSDRGHIAAYTEIWVMNSDGSSATKLGDGSRDAWAPVWIKWKK